MDITFIAEAIINYKTSKNKAGISDLLNIALDKSASENYIFNTEVDELLSIKDLDVKGVLAFISKIKIGNKHTRKHIALDEKIGGHNKQNLLGDNDEFNDLYSISSAEFEHNESTSLNDINANDILESEEGTTELIEHNIDNLMVADDPNLEDEIELEINKIQGYGILNPIELNVYLVNYDKLLLTLAVKSLPIKVFQYYLKQADLKVNMYRTLMLKN